MTTTEISALMEQWNDMWSKCDMSSSYAAQTALGQFLDAVLVNREDADVAGVASVLHSVVESKQIDEEALSAFLSTLCESFWFQKILALKRICC
jgi:hypothetical protein